MGKLECAAGGRCLPARSSALGGEKLALSFCLFFAHFSEEAALEEGERGETEAAHSEMIHGSRRLDANKETSATRDCRPRPLASVCRLYAERRA